MSLCLYECMISKFFAQKKASGIRHNFRYVRHKSNYLFASYSLFIGNWNNYILVSKGIIILTDGSKCTLVNTKQLSCLGSNDPGF